MGILVASKNTTANPTFEGHLVWLFEEPFFLPSGESGLAIVANAYPENIKAIGSTGKTNLCSWDT